MCGRYTLTQEHEELVDAFSVPALTFSWTPRYNIAPGQPAPILAQDRRGRRIGLMPWGLVPAWSERRGRGHFNARSESIHEKPSFREAFRRRRCLVPADGFFEWRRDGEARTPHWFHRPDRGVVTFAGVWERWRDVDDAPQFGFAILTTEANRDVADVHDRMPVVIARAERSEWLGRASGVERLMGLLRPAPKGTFAMYEVGVRVGRVSEDDIGLIDPIASGEAGSAG